MEITLINVMLTVLSSPSCMTSTTEVLNAVKTRASIVAEVFLSQAIVYVVLAVLASKARRTLTCKVVYEVATYKVSRTTVFMTVVDVGLAS